MHQHAGTLLEQTVNALVWVQTIVQVAQRAGGMKLAIHLQLCGESRGTLSDC